jgi:hypothetical protein
LRLTGNVMCRQGILQGAVMPRKGKALKSKLRDAAKAASKGDQKGANAIWRQLTVDRAKLKADKAAKRAAKKAPK